MSNVNTYKAIGFLITFLPEPVGDYMEAAQEHLRDLADAYDALAPNWANAPDWAQWYCVDASGDAQWTQKEPEASDGTTGWIFGTAWEDAAGPNGIDLPLGIDWRLCKWSRPEVTK